MALCFPSAPDLGSRGPGKLTEKGKLPKVLRGGCKRSFGPREQRSPKSLLHHPKLLLHRCKMGFGWCKRLFGDLCSLGPKDLLHPPLSTFGSFPFSVNFPGPRLPKSGALGKAGEIQKGTGGRGRDRKCHKLSQIVVTFYDEIYDDLL